jgi:hypothetical protein
MLVIGLCLLSAGSGVLLIWRKREEEEQKNVNILKHGKAQNRRAGAGK